MHQFVYLSVDRFSGQIHFLYDFVNNLFLCYLLQMGIKMFPKVECLKVESGFLKSHYIHKIFGILPEYHFQGIFPYMGHLVICQFHFVMLTNGGEHGLSLEHTHTHTPPFMADLTTMVLS